MNDPKVVIMLPDPMLDPDLYPDNEVLWVEYERDQKNLALFLESLETPLWAPG